MADFREYILTFVFQGKQKFVLLINLFIFIIVLISIAFS